MGKKTGTQAVSGVARVGRGEGYKHAVATLRPKDAAASGKPERNKPWLFYLILELDLKLR